MTHSELVSSALTAGYIALYVLDRLVLVDRKNRLTHSFDTQSEAEQWLARLPS